MNTDESKLKPYYDTVEIGRGVIRNVTPQLPAYVRMQRVRAAPIVAIDLPPAESGYRMAVLTLGLPDGGIVSERMPVTFLEARGVELNGYFLRHESGLADYRSSAEFEAEYSRAPNPVQVKSMEELETLLSMRPTIVRHIADDLLVVDLQPEAR